MLDNKPVAGYEDNYYLNPSTLEVVNRKTGRSLKPQPGRGGYPEVQLWKNNHGSHKTLHRLFAEAYVPNPDNLPCVNHKDEDTTNYDPSNLEWCDQSYNQNFGTANARRGARISAALKGKPRPWVTEQKSRRTVAVNRYGEEFEFPSAREAARQLGISQGSVSGVLSGRRKTAGDYTFYYLDT